jgi:hypothetical protein
MKVAEFKFLTLVPDLITILHLELPIATFRRPGKYDIYQTFRLIMNNF